MPATRSEHEPLLVFLPGESPVAAMIDPGSGIVGWGHDDDSDRVTVFYEGNRYHYANVKNFADRCAIAAGRALTDYPTTARLSAQRAEVHPIGVYDRDGARVVLSDGGEALLARWLDIPISAVDAELVAGDEFRRR